jgi:hypothetical protein
MNSNHPGSGRLLSNLSECARQQAFWGCWCNGDISPANRNPVNENRDFYSDVGVDKSRDGITIFGNKYSRAQNVRGCFRVDMPCKSCESRNQREFNGETAIHFLGLKGLEKPIVWVFPKLLVCLDCGFTEFTVPGRELSVLATGTAVEGAVVLDERER